MAYIGSTPTTQSFIAGTDYFNGTGSQVAFTLSRSVNSVNDIEVIVNNVEQIPSGYLVSGTTLTFSAAPSSGTSNVYVRYLSTTNLSVAPGQDTVGPLQLSASGTADSSTYLRGDNAWAAITFPAAAAPPAVTIYTSGSGTYTTPANCRELIVELCGGGSGGAGGGSYSGGGSAGGNTTFGTSLLQGSGGVAGGQYTASAGGGASIGSATGIALTGGAGMCSTYAQTNGPGGNGGNNPFGGGGNSGSSGGGTGGAGATNSGAGGGGGGSAGSAPPGAAGSAGGYVKAWITTPLATYAYAVGAGGAGASNTYNGGAGGSGVIIVTAYF